LTELGVGKQTYVLCDAHFQRETEKANLGAGLAAGGRSDSNPTLSICEPAGRGPNELAGTGATDNIADC